MRTTQEKLALLHLLKKQLEEVGSWQEITFYASSVERAIQTLEDVKSMLVRK